MFSKEIRAKMEKMFSSDADAENSDPPPPYTLPGDFVDAGIKEDDLAILKDYDTVIILDDSGSMEPLWGQACRALSRLADVAYRYDKNGIDVHFLNSEKVGRHLKSEEEVTRLFKRVLPRGPTPLGECLERVTHDMLERLDKKKSYKKTNFIVITDGYPTDDAEGAIVQIAKRLDKAGANLSQLGIQFIQIGTDVRARSYLERLDDELKEKHSIRDIIDTEPYTAGDVTAPRLTKLLLGGINRKIDRE